MMHPDIVQALGAAHRDDLIRAADNWRKGEVVRRPKPRHPKRRWQR